jgi:hypothetical protein
MKPGRIMIHLYATGTIHNDQKIVLYGLNILNGPPGPTLNF